MKDKGLYLVFFVAGAAIGSLATWKYTKTKYEQIAQEEIDSVKERYSKKDEPTEPEDEEPNSSQEDELDEYFEEVDVYEDIVKDNGYKQEMEREVPAVNVKPKVSGGPQVVSPEEFGEIEEYEIISLTYYADGVLTDLEDNIIEEDELEECIGRESLTHFGEYEDDSVFVINDEKDRYYEILRDERKYTDVYVD